MSWEEHLLGGIDFLGIAVMDAGTGAGSTTLLLARKIAEAGGKAKIVSVDIDPETFPTVKKKLGDLAKFVEFIQADLTCMPETESESFDLIVCTATICALNDRPLKALRGLAEFHRVLKEGGRLIITDDYPLPRATKPEEEVQVLRWQMYKAVAELTGEVHYTEIWPEELAFAVSLVGFRDIEWRRFEGGPLRKETIEEWSKVMPPMVNHIQDKGTREALLALIPKIQQRFQQQRGLDAPSYIMKMKK